MAQDKHDTPHLDDSPHDVVADAAGNPSPGSRSTASAPIPIRRGRGRPSFAQINAELGRNADDGAVDEFGLTPRQRKLLETIRDVVDQRGYPPSIREMGEAIGLASTSSVSHQLRALESKGYLRRDPHRPRALEVRFPGTTTEMTDRVLPEGFDITDLGDSFPTATLVPVVGRIAAGGPILAEQHIEEVFPLPRQIVGGGELFVLEVRGDSMVNAAICDRDWVVVRQQPTAHNGEIVAALLDDEATVKTFKRVADQVWLMPHNPAYDPIDGNHAKILGKVVAVIRRVL